MRKLGLIVALLMLLMLPAVAQLTFGVRAGGAYSAMIQNVEDTYRSGARFGFSIAGLADIPLYKGLSLRPELAFVNQGGSFISNPEIEGARNLYNKCNYYSIQIPVNLVYTFIINDIRLGVFAGPALDFSLFGKMKTRNQNVDINFGQAKETDLKSFDLGVNIGLRVDYSRYFFSISALQGTLDRRATKFEGESALYQNNVTLSLGYMFQPRF
jgi:Outer membrane protein beta-barrel domain